MLGKLKYFFKQAYKSMFGHMAMSIASVCIVTASLLLLGIFMAEGMNISSAMQRINESKEINVYLTRNSINSSIEDIENELKSIKGIDKVTFRSREDRLQSVIDEVYGNDGYIFSGDENPLRDSYIVTLISAKDADSICEKIMTVDGIEEIVRSNDIITGIDTLTNGVKNIYTWITFLFMLIAIFIIFNTIKLGVGARSDEIEIMKTIGATNGFVLTPFIIEAFILGVIGSGIASVIVISGYSIIVGQAELMISQGIIEFVPVARFCAVFIPSALLTGTIIGITGSILAARKYMK